VNELLAYFDSKAGRCKCGAKDGEAGACKFYLPGDNGNGCANNVFVADNADGYCNNTYAGF